VNLSFFSVYDFSKDVKDERKRKVTETVAPKVKVNVKVKA